MKKYTHTLEAPASFQAVEGDARTFSGVAYSGDALPDWQGSIIFDLASITLPSKLPMLISHDRAQRAGVADQFTLADNFLVAGKLLKNQHGTAVAEDADQGFPWQMSIHIESRQSEQVAAGVSVMVNGRQFTGPGQIYKNSTIREISFTPTGVDANTSAAILEYSDNMNLEQLQQQNTALTGEVAGLTNKLAASSAEVAQLKQRLIDIGKAERDGKIKELFAATRREYTEQAAAVYHQMSAEVFTAVSGDILAARASLPAALTQEQATGGPAPDMLAQLESDWAKFGSLVK